MPRGSHAPTLLRHVERACKSLLGESSRVLCAVSGGPDSMALLSALGRLRDEIGFELSAAGVDHGLREAAPAELDMADALSSGLGIPFTRLEVQVPSGSNLQSRARTARHGALQRHASAAGATCIALGHTADDRAETFLIRLLGGSGPRGLAVMPSQSPGVEGETPLIRPMLAARRSDVLRHLDRHDVRFASDPSNSDPKFLRVRVRQEVLPLLEELSPKIVLHLCSVADMLTTAVGEDDPLTGLGRAQRTDLERTLRRGLAGKAAELTLRLARDRELFLRFRRRSPKPKEP